MTTHRDPPHYLKPLLTTTTPKRLLWLDCAASKDLVQGTHVDRWSDGALGSTHYTSKKGERRDWLDTFKDASVMWGKADEFCKQGKRVVLFAHDLGYQLRVSQALVHLPELGWDLERIVLERTAAWALFRKDKASLMCCDLASWTPVDFSRIRREVNGGVHVKAEHPAGRKWRAAVAASRMEVIRAAVLQILGWIEAESLGPFRPTGSGQSYAAFRRRFHTHKLLVHDDVSRLELERVAMWTGRCEAWKHGRMSQGPYVEYDMHAAYPTIARECEVPTVAVGVMTKPNTDRLLRAHQTHALLAEVRVTTELPIVPCRVGNRTVWPVGTFNTVLWDPELMLALSYAEKVECTRAYKYRRGPALKDFCAYALDGMEGQTQVYGTVPQLVMKHWSRCMIGRLGLRYRSWEQFGTQDEPDLRLVTFIDTDENTSTDMLIAGRTRLILTELSEALESLPQIPGWVMSECRRRLWDTMARCDLSNVCYVDTDSIILRAHPTREYPFTLALGGGYDWRAKGTYDRMTINGPRNLELESVRRMSGLPLSARQVAPLEFTGEVMRSIKDSMRAGELDCVASIPRSFHFHTGDLRRQHLPNGRTAAYRLESPHATFTDGGYQ